MNSMSARQQGGFTLIEMILAVTLLAMILGLAYGGLQASIRASAKGEAVVEKNNHLRLTHQFIRRQISRMLPMAYQDDEEGRVMVEAGPDFVQFVAPMPGYLGLGGPHVQRLELARGRDGYELLYQHALLRDFGELGFGEAEPILLLDQVDDGGFEYLRLNEEGDSTEWVDQWEADDGMPQAVSLNLQLAEEVNQRWPVLETGMRVDGAGFFSRNLNGATTIEELRRRVRGRGTEE